MTRPHCPHGFGRELFRCDVCRSEFYRSGHAGAGGAVSHYRVTGGRVAVAAADAGAGFAPCRQCAHCFPPAGMAPRLRSVPVLPALPPLPLSPPCSVEVVAARVRRGREIAASVELMVNDLRGW